MGQPKTVYLIVPKTDKARKWLSKNTDPESKWLSGGLAVEHRFLSELLEGMKDSGLTEKDFEVL